MSSVIDGVRDLLTFGVTCQGCEHYWERRGECCLSPQGQHGTKHARTITLVVADDGTYSGSCSAFERTATVPLDEIVTEFGKAVGT